MIESIQKSNHIITNHVVFNGGLTTIRRKRTQKVHYNQIEGVLAYCTVFDENNNGLILDESVLNGGIYQLYRFGEHVFLERVMTRFYFSTPLQSEKKCNFWGTKCEYTKPCVELLQDAQGN